MKMLLAVLFLPSFLSAETVNIVFRPNGSSCRHIEIRGNNSRIVYVTTESEVANGDDTADTFILRQIKKAARASGCALTDRPCLRTFIEAQDFDLDVREINR